MTSQEILEKFLKFYEQKNHKQVPNVSLVPDGDSTLLFVNSGMFPLVPYLMGETHPLGTRLTNIQRCIRMEDLDEIGDTIHTLAFHMIGNWSLNDYFKEEQLPWKYEFFIKELGLDPERIVATVFSGDKDAPKDDESIEILTKIFSDYGVSAEIGKRIYLYNKEQGNWWQRGEAVGELGGPSSEVFYYLGEGSPEGKSPIDHEDEFVELGNSVFMEYQLTEKGWQKMDRYNLDYGGGLERIALAVQNKKDIFETDNFWPIIKKVQELSGKGYTDTPEITRSMRILADHIRGCVFLAMDGVFPSNKDQGYILRRLLRRMVRTGMSLGVEKDISVSLVPIVVEMFEWLYPDLKEKQLDIQNTFEKEEVKFRKTLVRGRRQLHKLLDNFNEIRTMPESEALQVCSEMAFDLYQSYGYPCEMVYADLVDFGISLEEKAFDARCAEIFDSHKEKSRKGSEQKFKGGLADHSEDVVKYHTTTHLLHMALRKVLGDSVVQQGSNITGERLRFDFNHSAKLTPEQIKKVEETVNNIIARKLPVKFVMMNKDAAEKTGAIHAFGEKYGEEVKIYYVGDSLEKAVSKEFCGGPHVENTGDLSVIEIYKQDKIGEGKLRIYARAR